MPPKSKPKKSTPPPAAKGKRAPTAAREPEVLNEKTVAADAAPARATPIKTERSLDILAEYLSQQAEPLVPVREAVAKAYGGQCAPDRELSTLKIVKDDDRFVIDRTADGVNRVGLVNVVATAATKGSGTIVKVSYQPTETSNVAAPPAKTLGDHVAEAKGRPQFITWKHGIGSRVLLLTEGQPDKKATIRNIHDHKAYALYDLNLGGAGGTINGLPAFRIGRDIEAEGEAAADRLENAALRRHAERGAELAQQHIQMAAVEKQLAETLKKHREKMDAIISELMEHNRSEPGQQDLRDLVGSGEAAKPAPGPSRGEKLKAPPKAAEDKLAPAPAADAKPAAKSIPERVGAGDVFALKEFGLTMAKLQKAAVNQGTASTGKPQTIKPVDLGTDLGDHVLAFVQDGIAVLLPVHTKAQWKAEMQDAFGFPLELPSEAAPTRLLAGGKLTGYPIRVGRAVCYLGAEADAVLLKIPAAEKTPEPPPRAVGKDAAAGE